MHGHYELLRSTSSENRDLKAGEVNLKRLGANLRFSSDNVAGPSLWARTSFGGDFILIAEFSENEGPKPVVSLPEIQLIRFKPPSLEKLVFKVSFMIRSRDCYLVGYLFTIVSVVDVVNENSRLLCLFNNNIFTREEGGAVCDKRRLQTGK